ncbi:poly-beta-1,6 N-acetyl-D-glucosamine export porin PgaA [Cupriavidus sp. CV2]|uniref:poly-beta-1,6 N-acetyl-D-glucosamine export porin PgaA n=1 Tax=Cupriavidus ulmosensis TaxID=3065913 RepID=UPI00296ACF67|nr:poly-beta-1,6 N-acetyl-D-glucosamine export porin PgaA [Cupriavidus sp. CV2]MDW3686288.1 poly-beta-1,6 N-acetyl-D-glucosamine export porin PgaA [Cupriavidus sp. CV2]
MNTSQQSRKRLRTTLKATAVLLALFAREHCVAETARPAAPRLHPAAAVEQPASASEKDQLRERIFALAEAGSPKLALEQAATRPDVFTPRDLLLLEHLVVAQQIRWARQQASASNDPDRLAPADGALAAADALLARIPADDEYNGVKRTAQADRLTALSVRGRMKEATALYEQLSLANEPLPASAYVAAGDAYAYLDKPDFAERAYKLALQSVVEPLKVTTEPYALSPANVQESLFFAYLDQGHYEAARELVSMMARNTPSQDELSEDTDKTNPEYGRVKKLQAQYLLYTNHVREGIEALDALRKDAPFDPSFLTARADGSLVLERPYASQSIYRQAQADHPGDIESLVGIGKTALQLHQYDQGKAVAAAFDGNFPDNNSVKNFQREYRVYERPQLIIDATGERGNAVLADHAWGVDTRLYSSPLADYWRIFAHQYSGRAATGDSQSVSRVRNGIGGDYRRDGWEAAAELHQSTGGNGKTGGTGTLAYQPNDHWRFGAGVDSDDNALPWKAYQAGVTGRTATANARYSQDDARYFNVMYGVSRYSDTNLHQQWEGTWYQRLMNQPRHQVSIWLDVGSTSNNLAGTAYFNPRRDYTAQLRSMYQWTPWRYAEKSFSQRVYATVGGYKEDGFGESMLWELRLEQYWQLGRKASLAYGIGVGSKRYDASRETSKLIYINLNIPL